mmetsp:Transcript_622/g.966  ORF Transcript_622/g.966 Transcript_622/m.966 type:complete len:161 (+) Transcript_622:137-619(+)
MRRCIFAQYTVGRFKGVTRDTQQRRYNKVLEWANNGGYVCGEQVPIIDYYTRVQLRCKDNIESYYYGGGREDICVYCSNNEDVLSAEDIKKDHNLEGREPYPLCKHCLEVKNKKDKVPTRDGPVNQVEKAQQARAEKRCLHSKAVADGLRRPTKRQNASK